MPLAIDATVGGASANSFATVAEADTYLSYRLNSAAWTGADPKMQALVEATHELCAVNAWLGYRVTDTQALAFPRDEVENPDDPTPGTYYLTTIIPQRIKDATCELALEFLRAGTTDIAGEDPTAAVVREVTDVLETDWQPGQRPAGLARYPRVWALIAPLLSACAGQVRLIR